MKHVVVIGGGPAGLMAADRVSAAGVAVTIVDRMPSLGRKLLMAGRGGLNLTHSEPLERFLERYGAAQQWLEPAIRAFPPEALIGFAQALGQETFVGSSGRVFPKAMKASPLLRAWLARLGAQGVTLRTRTRWVGLESGPIGVRLADEAGQEEVLGADAVVLALGGASWPRLGSDGAWVPALETLGVEVAPLGPANAGVEIDWSAHVRERFAGAALKRIALSIAGHTVRGEAVLTRSGIEGGAVYALSREIAVALATTGRAELTVDLRPDLSLAELTERLTRPRGKQSASNWLRKAAALSPAAISLLRERHGAALPTEPAVLAGAIKAVVVETQEFSGIARAISTAGGIRAHELTEALMLRRCPGVFAAGEMLDWQAPTGGYLLQACLSTGALAGDGVLAYLGKLGR